MRLSSHPVLAGTCDNNLKCGKPLRGKLVLYMGVVRPSEVAGALSTTFLLRDVRKTLGEKREKWIGV